MRLLAASALFLLAVGVVAQPPKTTPKQPATTQKKSQAAPKKAAASAKPPAAKKTTTAKKTTAAKKTTTAKKSAPKSRKRAVARKRTQQQPTPERYTDIQNALIARGHLQGPATGVWSADSAAALKRFQEEQKLESTGKLDALSLIRLGLGPKRDDSAQASGLPASEPR